MNQSIAPRAQGAPLPQARLKAVLLARLKTVQLLRMPEREIAQLIKDIESDPAFLQLLYPDHRSRKVVRFQPHPRTCLSPSFYELEEGALPDSHRPEAATLLAEGRPALALIRRMGQENFEKYFLRADEDVDRAQLAAALSLTERDIQTVRDFLLTYSVQSEFFDPPPRSAQGRRVTRLARVSVDSAGRPVFEFRSPLLARGRYDIHYERLRSVLTMDQLSPGRRRHLRALVRRLELINWRQNTLYRILELICQAQRHYLATHDPLRKTPLTQRKLSQTLAVAPSTINRAIVDRSLVLPWDEEVLLADLFCTRRDLCLDVLGAQAEEDPRFPHHPDHHLQEILRKRLGFSVPRRTLNTYRRALTPPPH